MDVRITVLENLFPQASNRLPQAVSDGLNTALLNIVAFADPQTPVDTGALMANKTIQMATPGSQFGSITWNQEYGIWVHEGTTRMEGRPFAQNAVDAATPGFMAELAGLGLV